MKKPRGPGKASGDGRWLPDPSQTPVSLEEASGTFYSDVTAATYMAVYDEVLKRWDQHCAITGERFPSDERLHPVLHVTAIRPLAAGGPLHASNFLPLIQAAARAFESGHIVIGHDFEMWADLSRVDPDLTERTVPLGKLVLPDQSSGYPDPAMLKWHREQVLCG